MENSITESNIENFLTKKGLRLLGMYLATKGHTLLEKKECLTKKAIQDIFWKALRPTFNRVYIHTTKGGQRLQNKMRHWLFRWLLSVDNFEGLHSSGNNEHVDQFTAIKKIIKSPNPKNVTRAGANSPGALEMENTQSSEAQNGNHESMRALRVRSTMLSRMGKLNSLRVLLCQIERQIPVNSAYEYNRQKNKSNGVYRLFCRQSKRTIDRLSKHLQKNKKFGARTNFLVRSEACVICSLDECLDEDDLFVYCDCCSILIHRKCLGISSENLKKQPWFCPNCLRKKRRQLSAQELIQRIQSAPTIDVVCGRKKKNGSRKTVSQVVKHVFDLSEGPCVLCGKEDGITLPMRGLPDHFAHVSCAKWLSATRVSRRFDQISFVAEDELGRRLNPFDEKLETGTKCDQFFSSSLYPVNWCLDKLFTSEQFLEDLKALKVLVRAAFKSSSPALNRDKSATLSSRLKKNQIMRQQSSSCQCLYHSVISVNFLFIFRRHLSKLVFPSGDQSILDKVSKSVSDLYPFIKGNYHRPRCPKGACADCHFPPLHKCQICQTSQGLVFLCSENKCRRLFHVECARRVFCEMVPEGLLSDNSLIFCPEHSKGSVFRREDSSKRRLQRKNLEICNLLNSHHQKVLTSKRSLERDGDFKFFEECIEKEFRQKMDRVETIEEPLTNGKWENGATQIKKNKGITKRIRKNKFLKLLQDKEMIMRDKLNKGVLNKESYWFLKFKKVRPTKKKILWNLKKEEENKYKIKNVYLLN